MQKTNKGTIIFRDGIAVANVPNALEWFHNNTASSMDWAIKNEGYSILEDDTENIGTHAVVNGWVIYLLIRGRRGYGMDGFVVRTLEELIYLSEQDGAALTRDRIVTEHVVTPMLKALGHALDYLSGDLANIGGELDDARHMLANKFGIDEGEL